MERLRTSATLRNRKKQPTPGLHCLYKGLQSPNLHVHSACEQTIANLIASSRTGSTSPKQTGIQGLAANGPQSPFRGPPN